MKPHTIIRQVPARSSLEKVHQLPTRLMVMTTEGCHIIAWQEILHCEAMSNYCAIHLQDGKKLILSKTLGAVNAILPKREFIRVHQSHLVNLNAIRLAGSEEVELEGNIKVPVARSRKKELINRISEISLTL